MGYNISTYFVGMIPTVIASSWCRYDGKPHSVKSQLVFAPYSFLNKPNNIDKTKQTQRFELGGY